MENFLIMEPGSTAFFMMLAQTAVTVFIVYRIMKDKTKRQKQVFLSVFYAVNLLIFFLYKYALSVDPEYPGIMGIDKFCWLDELPLHICNIVLLLMTFVPFSDRRYLLADAYIFSILGGTVAVLLPVDGFTGCSALLPRVMGYYFTHMMVLSAAPLLRLLGFYEPSHRDIPKALGFESVLFVLTFCINIVLRKTGLDPIANYFYSVSPPVAFFQPLYDLIPVPLLYLAPVVAAIFPLSAVIMLVDKGMTSAVSKIRKNS